MQGYKFQYFYNLKLVKNICTRVSLTWFPMHCMSREARNHIPCRGPDSEPPHPPMWPDSLYTNYISLNSLLMNILDQFGPKMLVFECSLCIFEVDFSSGVIPHIQRGQGASRIYNINSNNLFLDEKKLSQNVWKHLLCLQNSFISWRINNLIFWYQSEKWGLSIERLLFVIFYVFIFVVNICLFCSTSLDI